MNINHVTVVGRLGQDPELKKLPSGSSVCNFSVATSQKFKDASGEPQERTEWHSISAFGVVADNCAKFLKKGQLVAVEGRIETRSWDREDGTKGYKTSIIASNVQFGPSLTAQDAPGATKAPRGGKSSMKPAVVPPGADKDSDQIEYPTEDINPDDIPF